MKFFTSFFLAIAGIVACCSFQSALSPATGLYIHRLVSDTTKKDSVVYETVKGLPLKPKRRISFTTNEGTWTSLDISPDGKTIVFDMMGDLFTIPSEGGAAAPVTRGIAFDCHPRYSPDGKKLLFVSDRSGADNLWYIDLEKKDTVQLTKEKNQLFPDAAWTPDGNYIVYAKGKYLPKLYMMHKNGGGGVQLIDLPATLKTTDPVVSPDGRYIYYSSRNGAWNYNAQLPQYELGRYDRENAKYSTITSRYGSAFTPVLSKDSLWMVYGSRFEDKTGLILRNQKTGDEKWLAYPIQRDDQESIANNGVLPGMCFTPDSKAVLACYGGKIHRIPVDGSAAREIPFTVNMNLELGPELAFKYPVHDSLRTVATQIRDAIPSPDGKKLVFTVLNRLYVMDYPAGTPRRLTSQNFTESGPSWSKDGSAIVFSTWSSAGGNLMKISLNGKTPVTLNKAPGLFLNPVFNNEGDKIVFELATAEQFKEAIGPGYNGAQNELCWISANGGDIHVIDDARRRHNPHFVKGEDRIYLNSESGDLLSIQWNGTDEKVIAHVSGIMPYGFVLPNKYTVRNGDNCLVPESSATEPEMKPINADQIIMSPGGGQALAQIYNELYVVTIPKAGKMVNISVADPENAQFPSRKLTELGGEFPYWQQNGKMVHWSLGNTHFVYDLDKAERFEDSVKTAKKAEDKRKADSLGLSGDTAKANRIMAKVDSIKKDIKPAEAPAYKAIETEVKVYYTKDIPAGAILIKGARIITMKGNEVIENGDLLVEKNRIKAIGKSGSLTVPSGAVVIDAGGKTVIPGFVDTHSHMWPQWGIHKNQVWIYAANLAYGVTTTRDPQTATTDVLTYGDMVNAGMMEGPRVYSTGPGVGYWGYNVKDSVQAERILMQYSRYYHTNYIKMYITGNRQQRQWIIMAANNQKLLPTTEGALDFKYNMENLLDGYPGHEHAIPVYPLYKDVIKTIADARMTVTPTLLVAYGGPFAENYFYQTEKPYHDAKLQFFTPYEELAEKSRRRPGWFMDEEHVFQKHAKSMKSLVEANGLAGIGSHGQLQGLGYHWELWSMQSGGMKPMDALRVATILGATGLGLDTDLGSLETGKLADLIILDKNPLDNIRNSNTIRYVMKNGRVYDGNTCNQLYPERHTLIKDEWNYVKPVVTTDVKD